METSNPINTKNFPECPKGILKDDFERILKVHSKILENNSQPIPHVRELGEVVHMSPQKFRILFQKIFNQSYYQFYKQQRLEYAKALLQENKFSVVQIAYKVGFCHSQNFARAFIKYAGMTAKEYRVTFSDRTIKS